MPNWVTNKVSAPKHVIQSVVNDKGRIDFNLMAPFPGPRGDDWDGIYGDAETAAEFVLGIGLNENALIAHFEITNRRNVDIKKLSAVSFQQFVGMLENYRACGYLHNMAWARDKWGTKWNACEPQHDFEAGTMQFDTAWSCPEPIFRELSRRFPDDEIAITFADEDIGSNCGTFTLKGGLEIAGDVAPIWSSMSTEEKTKWRMFADQVKGYSAEEIAEREEERRK